VADEQQVRTRAGWIGVEISKSRVRTPGKPGFGLYRVRGTRTADRFDPLGEGTTSALEHLPWTAYAYGLNVIAAAVTNSIQQGRPEKPMDLHLVEDGTAVKTGEGGYAGGTVVPTRWTQQYTGRRDLGVQADHEAWVAGPLARAIREGEALRAEIGDPGVAPCGCANNALGMAPVLHRCPRCGFVAGPKVHEECAACAIQNAGTTRQRQRAANGAFQRDHAERRAYGLARRHEEKLRRGQA